MTKKALIIPGYQETCTYVVWKMVADKLEEKGYKVTGFTPDWKNKTHNCN